MSLTGPHALTAALSRSATCYGLLRSFLSRAHGAPSPRGRAPDALHGISNRMLSAAKSLLSKVLRSRLELHQAPGTQGGHNSPEIDPVSSFPHRQSLRLIQTISANASATSVMVARAAAPAAESPHAPHTEIIHKRNRVHPRHSRGSKTGGHAGAGGKPRLLAQLGSSDFFAPRT